MAKGRPRLTDDDLRARITAYCVRYGVTPRAEALPPFPTGRRETKQHREWMALYKAHHRSSRREPPVAYGARRELLARQAGRCPICRREIDLADVVVDHHRTQGGVRGLVHRPCEKLVRLSEAAGPEAVDRLRDYLWPGMVRRTVKSR